MGYTITVSETTYAALNTAAQARGLSLDALLDTLAKDALNQRTNKNMTGEEFLRYLGADDAEINAPLEEDDDGA